jgi:hypothetical protein
MRAYQSGGGDGYMIKYDLMDITGNNHHAAAMLWQIAWWTGKSILPGGWIYRTDEEWMEKIRISKDTVRRVADTLVELGFIQKEVRYIKGNNRSVYRINEDAFFGALERLYDERAVRDEESWDVNEKALVAVGDDTSPDTQNAYYESTISDNRDTQNAYAGVRKMHTPYTDDTQNTLLQSARSSETAGTADREGSPPTGKVKQAPLFGQPPSTGQKKKPASARWSKQQDDILDALDGPVIQVDHNVIESEPDPPTHPAKRSEVVGHIWHLKNKIGLPVIIQRINQYEVDPYQPVVDIGASYEEIESAIRWALQRKGRTSKDYWLSELAGDIMQYRKTIKPEKRQGAFKASDFEGMTPREQMDYINANSASIGKYR